MKAIISLEVEKIIIYDDNGKRVSGIRGLQWFGKEVKVFTDKAIFTTDRKLKEKLKYSNQWIVDKNLTKE
jgi:hypothetical protein